jgi:hypothetical protein
VTAGQRVVALAAVALLAGLLALALLEWEGSSTAAAPATAPAPGGGWYTALAASRGQAGDGERTTCGLLLTPRSLGVTHPVLPCRAKLALRYGDTTVYTEVIDNRLKSGGRQFEVTEALAAQMSLDGTQQVRWRFARPPRAG